MIEDISYQLVHLGMLNNGTFFNFSLNVYTFILNFEELESLLHEIPTRKTVSGVFGRESGGSRIDPSCKDLHDTNTRHLPHNDISKDSKVFLNDEFLISMSSLGTTISGFSEFVRHDRNVYNQRNWILRLAHWDFVLEDTDTYKLNLKCVDESANQSSRKRLSPAKVLCSLAPPKFDVADWKHLDRQPVSAPVYIEGRRMSLQPMVNGVGGRLTAVPQVTGSRFSSGLNSIVNGGAVKRKPPNPQCKIGKVLF